ncbi:carboxymuconolactone decarboxylase family protein [Streptosporangium sp. OZ121]|uniref:carboxymuconolactone decarboxylase family protein n=1 Tax=Streptosporangium sp. OZ121 TaxID=3444183 RepID=UPI003F7B0274
MPHIDLHTDKPGTAGLAEYSPETFRLISELAEILLRGENTLTAGERELIGAYVSRLNRAPLCFDQHAATAAALLPGGTELVERVLVDSHSAPITAKLKTLLDIAGAVQQSGSNVTEKLVAEARQEGATDREIHDTVLIAAAFCMYNRYAVGLDIPPLDSAACSAAAQQVIESGYTGESVLSS